MFPETTSPCLALGAYAGRAFTAQDDRNGATPVAVMSYSAWQQKYGQRSVGDRRRSFTFNGQPVTVVGIMPPGFNGDRIESVPALWIPLEASRTIDHAAHMLDFPDSDWLDITGRLAPGADPKSIEAHLQLELKQWLLSPIAKLDAGRASSCPETDAPLVARWRWYPDDAR